MSGKKTISVCENTIKEIVNDLGYYLVDIEYKKQISGMVLEVVIDNEAGITLNDCEKVSKALDKPLDDLDPTNGAPYSLNVSSMGLDRPLTNEYAYNKYKDKEIIVKLYEVNKQYKTKQLIGKLVSVNEEEVTIINSIDGQQINLNRKTVAQMVPFIKF